MSSAVLCKECHDWTGCAHCRFAMSNCSKCGKYALTAECFENKPIPARPPVEKKTPDRATVLSG